MTAPTIQLIATIALVAITAFYAWQTYEMVKEMREARRDQHQPHLVPALAYRGAGLAMLRIQNIGPGPATSIAVRLQLDGGQIYSKPWIGSFLASGDFVDFLPPKAADQGTMRLDMLTGSFGELTLIGQCQNVRGETQDINKSLDIRAMWEATREADVLAPLDVMGNISRHMARTGEAVSKIERLMRYAIRDLQAQPSWPTNDDESSTRLKA